MILTGAQIREEVKQGAIIIDPFRPEQLNPNSYNYRLGDALRVAADGQPGFRVLPIPADGYVLQKGAFALANTFERIGSSRYAASLIGRSSIGRLGLFVQVSANLGHVNSIHRWTLELFAAHSVRIYAGLAIGQVSFWTSSGEIPFQKERYSAFDDPRPSLARPDESAS